MKDNSTIFLIIITEKTYFKCSTLKFFFGKRQKCSPIIRENKNKEETIMDLYIFYFLFLLIYQDYLQLKKFCFLKKSTW